MRNLQRFMKGMFRRQYAVLDVALPFNSVIAVQFNHGVAAGNSIRPINLDLVVVLAESGERKK